MLYEEMIPQTFILRQSITPDMLTSCLMKQALHCSNAPINLCGFQVTEWALSIPQSLWRCSGDSNRPPPQAACKISFIFSTWMLRIFYEFLRHIQFFLWTWTKQDSNVHEELRVGGQEEISDNSTRWSIGRCPHPLEETTSVHRIGVK